MEASISTKDFGDWRRCVIVSSNYQWPIMKIDIFNYIVGVENFVNNPSEVFLCVLMMT